MERRRFLIEGGAFVLLLPAGWTIGCGGDSAPTELRFTSTNVEGHTHDLVLAMAALDAPPSDGTSRETTSVGGHVHVVALTQTELSQLATGSTIQKEASAANGHTHAFSLAKSAAGSSGNGGTY